MIKHDKWIHKILMILALVLSHLMCIHVAAGYTDMEWGNRMSLYSGGPPALAFLYAIPYLLGIALCIILSRILRKKKSQAQKTEHDSKQ